MTLSATFPQVKWHDACSLALRFPRVEVGTSYGTPSLRVAGKFLARLREDGLSFVLRVDPMAKGILLESRSDLFFTTPHFGGHPSVLVRLAIATPDDVDGLIEDEWRRAAPRRVVAAYDRSRAP